MKDTNPNDISGWQLPITKDNLNDIRVPLYMLAVGYNRFRGQDDFSECFRISINNFVKKADFVGLRNNGSIYKIKGYVDENLYKKIIYYPCPTTIISKLFQLSKNKSNDKFIVLNCAFDRDLMRYGENKDKILDAISRVIKKISERFEIKYYVHVETDKNMLPYLDKQEVKYSIECLNKEMSMNDFMDLYSTPELVIGMRGHAQMIPFGCCTPICSIVSHDKMNWFLEDIKHPEWGVDVNDENFEEKLLNAINDILQNRQQIVQEIRKIQNRLYKLTKHNLKQLKGK